MSPHQFELLTRFVRSAATDLTRAYSATWSVSRLRALLVHRSLNLGHQVLEQPVPGTPAYRDQRARNATGGDEADLQILQQGGDKLLFLDLLCGTTQAPECTLTVEAVHRSITRLSLGKTDALMIAADLDAYEAVQVPDPKLIAPDKRRKLVGASLPTYGKLNMRDPHHMAFGDITLDTVGVKITAFGMERLVCVMYEQPT